MGGLVEAAELGTTARIVDFSKLPDGLLGITAKGERKFKVLKLWQQPDGLNVGDVEFLPTEVTLDLPGEYHHLSDLLPALERTVAGGKVDSMVVDRHIAAFTANIALRETRGRLLMTRDTVELETPAFSAICRMDIDNQQISTPKPDDLQ